MKKENSFKVAVANLFLANSMLKTTLESCKRGDDSVDVGHLLLGAKQFFEISLTATQQIKSSENIQNYVSSLQNDFSFYYNSVNIIEAYIKAYDENVPT